MKQVKLTKKLCNMGYSCCLDTFNNLFSNSEIIMNTRYINLDNIDFQKIQNRDFRLTALYEKELKSANEIGEVDFSAFQPENFVDSNGRKTKIIHMMDKSKTYIRRDWHDREMLVEYGINEYYFKQFIPKLLKNNPDMKLMENYPKNYKENKMYFLVDSSLFTQIKIVGIIAPCWHIVEKY